MRPGGFVATAHIHAAQEERWQLISGTGQFRIGKEKFTAGRGETVLAPAGAAHIFRNHGDQELHAIIEFRPALARIHRRTRMDGVRTAEGGG